MFTEKQNKEKRKLLKVLRHIYEDRPHYVEDLSNDEFLLICFPCGKVYVSKCSNWIFDPDLTVLSDDDYPIWMYLEIFKSLFKKVDIRAGQGFYNIYNYKNDFIQELFVKDMEEESNRQNISLKEAKIFLTDKILKENSE